MLNQLTSLSVSSLGSIHLYFSLSFVIITTDSLLLKKSLPFWKQWDIPSINFSFIQTIMQGSKLALANSRNASGFSKLQV